MFTACDLNTLTKNSSVGHYNVNVVAFVVTYGVVVHVAVFHIELTGSPTGIIISLKGSLCMSLFLLQ